MRHRGWIACVLAGSLVTSAPGCTLIGAGLGSLAPKMEPVQTTPYHPRRGERIEIVMERNGTLTGKVLQESDVEIVLLSDRNAEDEHEATEVRVPRQDIAAIRVRRGNYARTGAFVGLAIDVVILVGVIAVGIAIGNALDETD